MKPIADDKGIDGDSSDRKRAPVGAKIKKWFQKLKRDGYSEARIGETKLILKRGDITTEPCDIVASSTNENLQLDRVQQEGLVREFAITTGGNLPCQFVAHINTPKTRDQWESRLQMVFQAAEAKSLISIALPALGTGNHDPKKMAKHILNAIKKFAKCDEPQNLRQITVVAIDEQIFQTFRKTISKQLKENKLLDMAPVPDEIPHDGTTNYAFDDPENLEIIHKMTDEQRNEIQSLERKHKVRIRLEPKHHPKPVVVEGLAKDVSGCVASISKIIWQAKAQQDLHQQVRWQYERKPGKFEDYSAPINFLIEKASLGKKPTAKWKDADGTHEVNFKQKKQKTDPNTRFETVVNVRRRGTTSVLGTYPSHWAEMKGCGKWELVTLESSSKEYKSIARKFQSAGKPKGIHRVQNPELYELYQLKKMQMVNPNEMMLYHGTAADTVQNINAGGFNRSYCGKNATAFGNGVYFAKDPMYSTDSKYAQPDAGGQKHVYQCKVLVGDFTGGQQGLKEPPYKDPASGVRYDSVVDDTGKPTMYVVFRDSQAYPEYLIQF